MKRFICFHLFLLILVVSVLAQPSDTVSVTPSFEKDKRRKARILIAQSEGKSIIAYFFYYKSKDRNLLKISLEGGRGLKQYFSRAGEKSFLTFTDSTQCELVSSEPAKGYVVRIYVYRSWVTFGYFEPIFNLPDSAVRMLQEKTVFKITVRATDQRTSAPVRFDFKTIPKRREKLKQLGKRVF